MSSPRLILSLACALAFVAALPASAGAAFGHQGNFTLTAQPLGIGTDLQGNVYIAVDDENAVRRYSPAAVPLSSVGGPGIGDGQFDQPYDVAAGPGGDLFVSDYGNERVQRLNAAGAYAAQWSFVSAPTHMATDLAGNPLTAAVNISSIRMTDRDGAFVRRYGAGSHGDGDGQLDSPAGVDVDAAGNVFVVDADNHRIVKFDAAANFVSTWGYGVAGGTGWEVCTSNCAAGVFANPPGGPDVVTEPFWHPTDLSHDPVSGEVLVADAAFVRRFSDEGELLGSVASRGTGTEQFSRATRVEVDCRGRVYIGDSWGEKVLRFGDPDAPAYPCAPGQPTEPTPPDAPPPGQPGPGQTGSGQTGPAPLAPGGGPGPSTFVFAGKVAVLPNGTVAQFVISVPAPGTVTTSEAGGKASASILRRPAKKGRGTKRTPSLLRVTRTRVTRAGRVKVRARLSGLGKRRLAKRDKVPVKVRVSFRPATGGGATARTRRVVFEPKRSSGAGKKKQPAGPRRR